ncbi:MAG: hypothetical protein ACRDJ9_04375 [Dehalococcoidia bacterium]
MLESERQYAPPEPPSIGRMACLIPGFLIAVAIAVGATFGVVSCLRASSATSYTTRIDALPPETPVFLSDPGIYLVRLPAGVIALDHHELRREDALEGCLIRWRETLESAGRRGLFRSDCTGTLYGLDGNPVEGSGLPMKRHPIKRDGDKITVDFESCISPGEGNAEVKCRPV